MTEARLAERFATRQVPLTLARRAGRAVLVAAAAILPALGLAPLASVATANGVRVAEAAPLIAVRTGTHPGFGRVVFDWPARTSYEAIPTADGLLIRFAARGRARLGGVIAPRNVNAILAEGEAVRILAREGARFRTFHHGPKLVVDVLDPGAPAAAAEPASAVAAPASVPAEASAETVLADLAEATHLPAPSGGRAARPALLASAAPGPAAAASAALVPDVLPRRQAETPAALQVTQALPPAGRPMRGSPVVQAQAQGFSLLPPAQAQTPMAPPMPGLPQVSAPPGVAPQAAATLTRPLVLEQGSGRLVELPAAAITVLVADPRIARVQPASPTSLFVMGVNPGRTNLIATREDGSLVAEFDITVQASVTGAAQVAPGAVAAAPPVSAGQIQSMIRRMVNGGQNVRVTAGARGPITLSGMVPTAADAQRAEAIAKSMAGEAREVLNNLTLLSGIQVNLRVRVAEISREVTRDLGFNWLAAFNDGSWQIGLRTGAGVAGTIIGALTGSTVNTGGLVGLGYNRGNFDINAISTRWRRTA